MPSIPVGWDSFYAGGVTLTVHLPAELAARLAAEATRRQITVDELLAELVAARLGDGEDPLEAFIASGASGRGDLGRQHRRIKADLTGELTARDL